MAHPHSDVRQSKVEHSRVGHITRGYATGGAVKSGEGDGIIKPSRATGGAVKSAISGAGVKARQDRPGRARGGRTKAGKTNVNVIVAPQNSHPMTGTGPVAAGPAPMPVKPPMAPPPGPPMGAGPMAGPPPGGPPMPMPPRAAGGRTYATGGAVKSGPAWEEGRREGTQVTHSPGKNDQKDVGRGKPVTYRKGGAVKRATGGRIGSENGPMGPKFDGGAGGGTARQQKEARAERKYKKAP